MHWFRTYINTVNFTSFVCCSHYVCYISCVTPILRVSVFHSLQCLYNQEQKGIISALESVDGLVLACMGQKVYTVTVEWCTLLTSNGKGTFVIDHLSILEDSSHPISQLELIKF